MINKKKIKLYPWLNFLYKKIISSKFRIYKNYNLLITYPCNLGVDLLVYRLVKWILCLNKKDIVCNNCVNCNLLNINNHPNFFLIKDIYLNISLIKKINCLLNNNLSFSFFKIIYFSNFNFLNPFIYNYLLKLMEEPYYKLIFIFSCFNIYNIPATFFSRCYKYKLFVPKELFVYKWLNKNCNCLNFNKKEILTTIRLNGNSPLDSKLFLEKKWFFRLKILNVINNILFLNINDIINMLKNYFLDFNLYMLYTFFFDSLNYKHTNKIYNLDCIYIIKKIRKNLCTKNINLILKKIIICINEIKSRFNFNKNILIYDFSYYIYFLIHNKN